MHDQQDVLILNALEKAVHVVAFGNHFNLKPRQLKIFRGEIGQFMDSNKGYLGLIAVPVELSEPEYRDSEEGKAVLEQKIREGVNRRAEYLTGVVNNLKISLRGDLEQKNIKAPIETQATKGEIEAMDELITLQKEQKDDRKAEAEKARVKLRIIEQNQVSQTNRKE